MSKPASPPTKDPRRPVFAALSGLTSLAILAQAFFAGEFIQHGARGGWLDAHSVGADVASVLAVMTAIYAFVKLRPDARALMIRAIVLAVLVIIQNFIGHEITDSSEDWLIPIHVPLALLIFGLTVWLSASARSIAPPA
jgi:ABC-type uncharacterized transport system permease subunit